MNDLKGVLRAAEVRTALVVDDAYDEVPLAADLRLGDEAWTQFFDDLSETDKAILREMHPEYEATPAGELRASDAFVAGLWSRRAELSAGLGDVLFGAYEAALADDRVVLEGIVRQLSELGLGCTRAGRDFSQMASEVDLILIDLFLGSTQDGTAIDRAVNGLTKALKQRSKPPLVILMSRSPRLADKREHFRERSGLFASMFRIVAKADVNQPARLQSVLARLAGHYGDSRKLASFLDAWRTGFDAARERTAAAIRTLDLADCAQIRQLLLDVEGESAGCYLVDVVDRVLLHECERHAPIIDAAIALNDLTTERYPPPYIAGSPDLQSLVYRSLFQHPERIRLSAAEGSRVAFGDILRRTPLLPEGAESTAAREEEKTGAPRVCSDVGTDQVMLVLTPACDLQRRSAKRVMFLVGELRALEPKTWSFSEDPLRTPIIELPDGERRWIRWDLLHVETLAHEDLDGLLDMPRGFRVIARLREAHTLQIQQRLLSRLGRVGTPAQLVGTFPVSVAAYVPGEDEVLREVPVPALRDCGGVCYVGRDGSSKPEMRLVLCEDCCEATCQALAAQDASVVHADARQALEYLRTGEVLRSVLERGLKLPPPERNGFSAINVRDGQVTDGESKLRSIGLVFRRWNLEDRVPRHLIRQGGIVLWVGEFDGEGT
jgi:hypothetical protein